MWMTILDGFNATYQNKTIFQTLLVNFASSIFNAGAFLTVIPFIVKRVYEGDALGFATIMIVFYAGATVSNIIQFKIMPITRPGFWFLIMQLTRVVIVGCVWLTPDWWLLMVVFFVWGLNMGVTTTLSRTIVQESGEPQYLARIFSVYSLGLLGSMPIGALLLGYIIELSGTMNALLPAMFVSGGPVTIVLDAAGVHDVIFEGNSPTGVKQLEKITTAGTTPVVGTAEWSKITRIVLGAVTAASTLTTSAEAVKSLGGNLKLDLCAMNLLEPVGTDGALRRCDELDPLIQMLHRELVLAPLVGVRCAPLFQRRL